MNESFEKRINGYTDKKLRMIILNPQDYQSEFVEIAKKEFQKRKLFLNEDEIKKLQEKESELEDLKSDNNDFFKFCQAYNENIVDSPSSIQLYSRKHITVISLLFTLFFGGIMIGYNLYVLRKIKEMLLVGITTLVLSAITIGISIAFLSIETYKGREFGFLIAGYLFISKFFVDSIWWNFIGNRIQFKPKSINFYVIFPILIFSILIYYFVIK
jgi:hypothetical protein